MIVICSTTSTFQSSNYTCTYILFYCGKCDDDDDDNDSDKDDDDDDDNSGRNDNNDDNYI